jgi:hypothetical protein
LARLEAGPSWDNLATYLAKTLSFFIFVKVLLVNHGVALKLISNFGSTVFSNAVTVTPGPGPSDLQLELVKILVKAMSTSQKY